MGDLAVDSHVASAIEERNCVEQAEQSRILDIERALPVWKAPDELLGEAPEV